MNKNLFAIFFSFFLLVVISTTTSVAQDLTDKDLKAIEAKKDTISKLWLFNGSANATFTNTDLQNWAGGGNSSIAGGILLQGRIRRQTERSLWETTLSIAAGAARVGGSANQLKKTDDQLILNSAYDLRFDGSKWSYFSFFNFRTQMLPGYTYKQDSITKREVVASTVSYAFSPAFLLFGSGFKLSTKVFAISVAPIGGKLTFVLDDSLSKQGAFGVTRGQNLRSEFGYNVTAALNLDILQNVNVKSNLNLFGNYAKLANGDVNWETIITFKVNSFLNANFSTQLIYDDDTKIKKADGSSSIEVQFKQVLAIGIGLKF